MSLVGIHPYGFFRDDADTDFLADKQMPIFLNRYLKLILLLLPQFTPLKMITNVTSLH